MSKISKIIFLFFISFQTFSQNVSLEDVWQRYKFYPKTGSSLNWMQDSNYYTDISQNKVVKYKLNFSNVAKDESTTLFDGNKHNIRIEGYEFSSNEDKILIATQKESIYRRSSKAYYYIYDLKLKKLQKLSKDSKKQMYATFSPDGSKVAFVRENDLFYADLSDMQTYRITNDGKQNNIINGATDWVYEEEFAFAKAFFWSPNSQQIAFYKFDESQVKEFTMQYWQGKEKPYPNDYKFKYPKAGEKNSEITISVFDFSKKKIITMDIGSEKDIYIPRINWTQTPNLLSIRRMNRLQNKLEVLHAQTNTGKSSVVLTEEYSKGYVDVEFTDDLTYLKDGKSFIHTSERDGYKHIYMFNMSGKLLRKITSGNWEVSEIFGIDEDKKTIYFSSTEVSSIERHLYKINFNGKGKVKLSQKPGKHSADFSKDFKYYLDFYSSAEIPPVVTLNESKKGSVLKTLVENNRLITKVKNANVSPKEFMTIKNTTGTKLNAWMIKPKNFDPNKKYPLLMFVYGGPGNQQVENSWDYFNFFWYQVLASKGYIIACVDNRGTGGKGRNFRQSTYANLGKLESQDQIDAAKYFGQLNYIDSKRIGIWGWSYGGYMSSLCLMLGNDIFKFAIAVAPVSNWRFYDTIYTERYLKTPQTNASGYDDYCPLTHVKKLKGNFLLVHGTGDDNVHFQNAIELQNALIKANKQFSSFYYPNKNHGIYGGNTRFHLYQMMQNFILNN